MFSRVPGFGSTAAAAHENARHVQSHRHLLQMSADADPPPPPPPALRLPAFDASQPAYYPAATSAALTVDDEEFNRLSGDPDWWLNAIEEDSFDSPLPFDASESGLWNGRFVPPPPRPPFLDESIPSDGLTTCDLCTWAWHDRNTFSLDASIGEAAGELGWAFTLIIVSVISALLGAIVMVVVLRCRRLKTTNANGGRSARWWQRGNRNAGRMRGSGSGGPSPDGRGADGRDGRGPGGGGAMSRSNMTIKQSADSIRSAASLHNNPGVWTWLGQRRPSASPDQHHQMGPGTMSPAENHYTHMDDSYSPVGLSGSGSMGGIGLGALMSMSSGAGSGCPTGRVGSSPSGTDEALYAELDRESIRSGQHPSYQNTAYSQCGEHDVDVPIVSSAPSSAYYSDLSTTGTATTLNDRGYEVVGMTHMSPSGLSGAGSWDASEHGSNGSRRPGRLAAINETTTSTVPASSTSMMMLVAPTATVPSDYV